MTLSYIPSDTNDEGILKAAASGSLPNGKPVVVNADGTVSVVGETSVSQSAGSLSEFASSIGSSVLTGSTFDSSAGKVVVAYQDAGDSNKGKAAVGTVSGDSISFGTPVTFNTGQSSNFAATFDSSNSKVVIAYTDIGNSNRGTAVVATVSGTNISFGSEAVFETGATYGAAAAFDSYNDKVVITYQDNSNNNFGSAVVGTVSGTSISFGTKVQLSTATYLYGSIAFDSFNNKILTAYRGSGSSYGRSRVGTVSGTSISFGTEVVFESATTAGTDIVYDSNANKAVLVFNRGSNVYGVSKVGTVSGTTISFGTEVVYKAAASQNHRAVYHEDAKKVVIAYQDGTNSYLTAFIVGTVSGTTISYTSELDVNYVLNTPSITYDSINKKVVVSTRNYLNSSKGMSAVYTPAYTSANLTAENYIGISTGGTYASGSNATIKIIGNTSNEQSSLTAGQAYYVQTDGTIGTTAGSPSVFAGTAISATKLIVKT